MGTNQRRKRSNKRQAIFLLLLVVLLAAGYQVLSSRFDKLDKVEIRFHNPDGTQSQIFNVEVARNQAAWSKGLKYRKPGELAEDSGMLFIFPEESVQSFWMQDVYIPLDMIFVGAEKEVVGVLHQVPIMNTKPRKVEKASQYVVELLGGVAKKAGIKAGSKLTILEK